MNYLMIFADGFEDTEAIATLDVLKRGNELVTCASLMKTKAVKTKSGYDFIVDKLIEEVDISLFDALIIPGGPASFLLMPNMPIVKELIDSFVKEDKVVASICAAPHLIGKLGYFKNRKYTVHPGFEKEVIGGDYLRSEGVIIDGRFITAKSMYYSIAFGLAIYEYFHGSEARKVLELSLKGEK